MTAKKMLGFTAATGRAYLVPGSEEALQGLRVGVNADGSLLLSPCDPEISGFSLSAGAALTLALILHRELIEGRHTFALAYKLESEGDVLGEGVPLEVAP